ncbi:suppressor APC domain-containing protein 2-like isoform X2 [Erythrolamprus reginae]|uniref:suppressor APC domain-containing protein 2-like isoform X2 n=1 Tax=Erythrolamprus reginae TaxID=121349 RepID=UPI00396C507B
MAPGHRLDGPPPPRAFLQSLRPLYDILDERRRGYVHLREIESRWRRADGEAGPAGVLEGLRRAAPPSGYLTFERFVLGLRLALPGPEESPEPSIPVGQAPPQPQGHRAGEASGSRKPLKEPLGQEGPCQEPPRQPSIRRQRRRHTLAHGVDQETLEREKEREKERECLLRGLGLAEEARGWYLQQLHRLQGHQKQLARSRGRQPGDSSPPTASHSPPATQSGPSPFVGPQQTIHMLKEQNRLLTKEVTDKGRRITQLEQEKSALIKQLFGARAESTKDSSQLDSTFI